MKARLPKGPPEDEIPIHAAERSSEEISLTALPESVLSEMPQRARTARGQLLRAAA